MSLSLGTRASNPSFHPTATRGNPITVLTYEELFQALCYLWNWYIFYSECPLVSLREIFNILFMGSIITGYKPISSPLVIELLIHKVYSKPLQIIYKAFHNQVLPPAFAPHFSCHQTGLNQTQFGIMPFLNLFAFPSISTHLGTSQCFTSNLEKALYFPVLLGDFFPYTPVYPVLPSTVAVGYSSEHGSICWEWLVKISYLFKIFK